MAKQTEAQQDIVERVMHEFKQGELETAAGRKVKDSKQAIAIGLSEAGASNRQSPARNRAGLRDTDAKQKSGGPRPVEEPTRAELYERATTRGIAGRSRMSKAAPRRALEA